MIYEAEIIIFAGRDTEETLGACNGVEILFIADLDRKVVVDDISRGREGGVVLAICRGTSDGDPSFSISDIVGRHDGVL